MPARNCVAEYVLKKAMEFMPPKVWDYPFAYCCDLINYATWLLKRVMGLKYHDNSFLTALHLPRLDCRMLHYAE